MTVDELDDHMARLKELGHKSVVLNIEDLEAILEHYDDMEDRFGCLLDHATGGRMSETNYTREVMYEVVDEYVSEQVHEALVEASELETLVT